MRLTDACKTQSSYLNINCQMKRITKILTLFVFLGCQQLAVAQKSKATYGTFALKNATIETVTKGKIENGTIVLQGGKILALGTNVDVPAEAESIDCSGLTIYPGMIEGGSRVGLVEVNSDARTRDYREIGQVIPHVQALTAINPNSVLIPVSRVSGVTTALAAPSGGLFPGTAALINLHGYTPEQMYAGFKGVVLNFPSSGKRAWWDSRKPEEIKKEFDEALESLNGVWERTKQYHKIDSAIRAKGSSAKVDYYPEMDALLPVYRGEASLLVEVNAANDIKLAIEWVTENKIKAIFTGVQEGWRMAEELAEAKIPVVVGPVLSNPTRGYDRYDKPYANAGIMFKAGVKVAIRTNDAENIRNLPYNAGFAATYGLGKDEALKAVTIAPAEIFGVSDKLGSLEVGKNATLFVTDGDPFETKTRVKYVFIDGWNIPMESRHTKLYDEFLKREPGLKR